MVLIPFGRVPNDVSEVNAHLWDVSVSKLVQLFKFVSVDKL
jgi:hypothetical protein